MWPSVAVLIPTFNEERWIGPCLDSLAKQDYAGRWTVVLADGGSTDDTLTVARKCAKQVGQLTIVENPRRVQSAGLNLAARETDAVVLIRADAHTTYATDYIRCSVEALVAAPTDVVAVGGPLRAEGSTHFGQAVATALRLPLGTGPAAFHHATERMAVDTVYLGAFRREDFLQVGGYRTLPSAVAEDADLYWRWRRQGRKVLLDPAISSLYRPRDSLGALARQHFRYGLGKAELLWLDKSLPSWRPLAPFALVVAFAAGFLQLLRGRPTLFVTVASPWVTAIVATSVVARETIAVRARLPLVIATMHLAYGLGAAVGLAKGRRAVRSVSETRPLSED